jgi:hypothetical protein
MRAAAVRITVRPPITARISVVLTGVGLGVLATSVYGSAKGWAIVIPVIAGSGGVAAALIIGAVAGLVPAIQALWSV